MIVSEAITRVQRKLGYRSDKSDEILDELKDVQQTLEQGIPVPGGQGTFIPWFLTTETATALTTINEERLLLPTDFLRELEDVKLYRYDADAEDPADAWTPLVKDDPAFLKAKFDGTDTTDSVASAPRSYWLSGGYIRLRPVPQAEHTMKLIYGGADTVLTLVPDITNKWLTSAPWLLVAGAGMALAQSLRDASAFQSFQMRFATEQQALYQATLAREITNDRPVMGGEN